MLRLRKKNNQNFIEDVIQQDAFVAIGDRKQGLNFLVSFFSSIRPSNSRNKNEAERNLTRVVAQLNKHPQLLKNLQRAILSQLVNTNLTPTLTESGIPLARGFWQEFSNRLKHKILPPLQNQKDFLYVINSIFFKKTDFEWVELISRDQWIHFFEQISLSFRMTDPRILKQLMQSVTILSFQIAQLGLEREVTDFLPPEYMKDNPFVRLNYMIHELEEKIRSGVDDSIIMELSARIKKVLSECYSCIAFVRERQINRGANLNQTYILLILSNRLERMQILMDTLDVDQQFDVGRLVDFFRVLVRNENRKNSIREFLSQGLGYIAYQIAEHKGFKGNKYITSTASEYWQMIRSAMQGGGFICFVAIIKNLLALFHVAPFWQGFLYSLNYSAGFIAIDLTNSTLATKQPAFTASAVAVSLDSRKNVHAPDLENLAVTVAKVSRSQIASFFGNLIIVFPGTFLLAWLHHWLSGAKLAEGSMAQTLLKDQHPWHSLSLLYACNTGFFLFLSGIIAGYIQNKIQYSRIGERLKMHPVLKMSTSVEKLEKWATFIERNAGTIIGSIALGFFLGMAGIVGKIFGVPFDIRHITISAANTAIGVYGLGFENIPPLYLLTIFLGVLCIGLLNFLVSFSFAFAVAVKSRGIHLREYPEFLQILWKHFKKNPLDFIRPGKKGLMFEV